MQVQAFDHLPFDPDCALGSIAGFVERRQYPSCPRDVSGIWGEGDIARIDLARVDERLAIEAEVDCLARFGSEARFVLNIVEHAIKDGNAVSASSGHRKSERSHERQPQSAQPGAGFLGKVIGSHDEGFQPVGPAISSSLNSDAAVSIMAHSGVAPPSFER